MKNPSNLKEHEYKAWMKIHNSTKFKVHKTVKESYGDYGYVMSYHFQRPDEEFLIWVKFPKTNRAKCYTIEGVGTDNRKIKLHKEQLYGPHNPNFV